MTCIGLRMSPFARMHVGWIRLGCCWFWFWFCFSFQSPSWGGVEKVRSRVVRNKGGEGVDKGIEVGIYCRWVVKIRHCEFKCNEPKGERAK